MDGQTTTNPAPPPAAGNAAGSGGGGHDGGGGGEKPRCTNCGNRHRAGVACWDVCRRCRTRHHHKARCPADELAQQRRRLDAEEARVRARALEIERMAGGGLLPTYQQQQYQWQQQQQQHQQEQQMFNQRYQQYQQNMQQMHQPMMHPFPQMPAPMPMGTGYPMGNPYAPLAQQPQQPYMPQGMYQNSPPGAGNALPVQGPAVSWDQGGPRRGGGRTRGRGGKGARGGLKAAPANQAGARDPLAPESQRIQKSARARRNAARRQRDKEALVAARAALAEQRAQRDGGAMEVDEQAIAPPTSGSSQAQDGTMLQPGQAGGPASSEREQGHGSSVQAPLGPDALHEDPPLPPSSSHQTAEQAAREQQLQEDAAKLALESNDDESDIDLFKD